MAKRTLNRDAFTDFHNKATAGGTQSATSGAEERVRKGLGLDPLVDPKGPAHLGPIRRSLSRFEKQGDLWLLTNGVPMSIESLLDGTGSMGKNVDLALAALIKEYEMLTSGNTPILGRYDPQIANGVFNDIQDNIYNGIPVYCRSQFEMDEKIAMLMSLLVPGYNGCGNGKEDPQFGIFGAAYLTAAAINGYGLKDYHLTTSDEPIVPTIDLMWLKQIFGDDVLDRVKENGFTFDAKSLPDTAQAVMDLQKRSHAFFLQVGKRADVTSQWTDMYGADHVVMLPGGTEYLHCVKATIIGLTEGVLDLKTAVDFLREHDVPANESKLIVRAVAHIPLGAQMLCENFNKLPKAGDLFRNKTDLWPIDPNEVNLVLSEDPISGEGATWL